jgi:hypothetical protein
MRARTPSSAEAAPRNTKTEARRTRALGVSLGTALLCVPLLAGCSDSSTGGSSTEEYCAQYEDLVAAAAELRAKDPSADVEELRAAAGDVSDELDEFQAVAEGPLDDALTGLRERVDGVRQSAEAKAEAGTEAVDSARADLEDELAGVEAAWARVQQLAETRCATDGSS